MGFLELRQEPVELQRGSPFETPLCSAKSGLLSSYDGHLRNLSKRESIIQMLLEVSWETKRPFLDSRKILGFPSIFKKSQALSPLRVELHEPLEVSKDVRPPVQMRRGTRVLSRVSTEDSDISSS